MVVPILLTPRGTRAGNPDRSDSTEDVEMRALTSFILALAMMATTVVSPVGAKAPAPEEFVVNAHKNFF